MVAREKRGQKPKLDWRLAVIWIVAVAVVCLISFAALRVYRYTEASITEQFNNEQLVLARSTANAIETLFQSLEVNLYILNALSPVQYLEESTYQARMNTTMSQLRRTPLEQIQRINAEGKVVAVVGREGLLSQEAGGETLLIDYLPQASLPQNRGKIYISSVIAPRTGELAGRQVVVMAFPTYEETAYLIHPVPTHNFAGLTAFVISLDRLAEKYVSPIKPGKTGYAWMVNSNGTVLSHPNKDFIGKDVFAVLKGRGPEVESGRLNTILREKMLKGAKGIDWYLWEEDETGKVKELAAFTPIHIGDDLWSIAVCTPYAEVTGLIKSSAYTLWILLGITIIAILSGAGLFTNRVRTEDKIREQAFQLAYQQKVEKELEQAKKFYESILESVVTGVWVADREGVTNYANKAMGIIAGIPAEKIAGTRVLEDFGEGVLEFFRSQYLKAKETLSPTYYDSVPMATLADKNSYQSGWLIPIVRDGHFDGMICTVEDVTERKRVEEELTKYRAHLEEMVEERTRQLEQKTTELEQANIRLQELDRLKSVFLASMSHELRTPLNSIIGFTGIILQGMSGEINQEQRKQLTMVKNSANHLLSLINDVLDVSKIEAGRVELSPEEMRLDDVVKEVADAFSLVASEKDLELVAEVPTGISLRSDKRRVKQVLMNLVSNAIKFTDRGSVKIAARVAEDRNLEIRVIDTGIGIKEEDINKLFLPFQQVGMPLTKNYEGTGLGLHLAKRLATFLGGGVSVKSEYGRGSEFILTIPL
ncbi:MAG: hypothetical protein A2Z75_08200 [Chloroflexi bacterium RBG_13_50_10]|nr:MAG: hypothetical protein A2Z75_08200 [Chloroflexi bacterium RBG_13_50_10]